MSRLSERWSRLPLSGRLAAVALLLGLGALAIGSPSTGTRVTLDTRELAAIVESEVDHLEPEELADWLIAGRQDFRLIDLRGAPDFAEYRIPGAERHLLADLAEAELPRNEKLVLYSEEGIHSAQAWMLLKAHRYPAVYMLSGGLKGWKERVLYPTAPAEGAAIAERAAFARAAEIAKHFGGAPRAAAAGAAATAVAALPMPAAAPVVAPPPAATTAPAKKKREGC